MAFDTLLEVSLFTPCSAYPRRPRRYGAQQVGLSAACFPDVRFSKLLTRRCLRLARTTSTGDKAKRCQPSHHERVGFWFGHRGHGVGVGVQVRRATDREVAPGTSAEAAREDQVREAPAAGVEGVGESVGIKERAGRATHDIEEAEARAGTKAGQAAALRDGCAATSSSCSASRRGARLERTVREIQGQPCIDLQTVAPANGQRQASWPVATSMMAGWPGMDVVG